jgi:hypothetical protein
MGLLVPGDAGLVDAVQVLVQLVAVEQNDLEADLAPKPTKNCTGISYFYLSSSVST